MGIIMLKHTLDMLFLRFDFAIEDKKVFIDLVRDHRSIK